jgi:ribonuclease-3 family protein
MDIRQTNTTALAYLGDAVYEVYVRESSVRAKPANIDAIHRMNVRYVRAEGQEVAIRALLPELTEEEQSIVRRARNHKITSKPKNANPVTYKMATAFEALIGYLYMTEQKARMEEIIRRAMKIIDESGGGGPRVAKAPTEPEK